jgi:hypothetical protein
MTDWLNGAACWYCPSITPLQLAAFVKALAFDDTHRLLAVCDKNPQIHKEDAFFKLP